ncbi:MAG: hypothetical protein A2Z29_04445 [Chloroflexi bacterium RBG_16_56_11]|nr:MAG: hypothetical protein A2Z29_04445 [Chloroflexi bacterium RBG_16_56_11]
MMEKGFHYDVGEYKCVVFSDGTLVNDKEVFGLNSLLIDAADHKILIDTGCGDGFQSTAGHLVQNLEAEGIKCADIDRIVLTHGHIDHVSGTLDAAGGAAFPGARFITSEKEWEYWVARPEKSEFQTMLFSYARKDLLPLRDRFDLVKENTEILPGVKLMPAPGHTPGNIIVEISSRGQRLVCIGDIIHSPVELVNPEYLSLFDVEPEQALKTRSRVLNGLAQSGAPVFACHFAFPGLGHINHSGGVLAWQAF